MKKTLSALMAVLVLSVSLAPAFANGWHSSQRRQRKAYKKSLKQEADFWKKFDAEMSSAKAPTDDHEENARPARSKVGK